MKILLPNSLPLDVDLPDGVTAVTYQAKEPVPAEHRDAEALVAWGNGRTHLAEMTRSLPDLRWVQSLSAGADSLRAARFAEDVVLTGGSGLHDRPAAEHALTLTLALLRRLPAAGTAQRAHRWASELGGVQPLHPDGAVTSLLDARILVWGFGSIGQTLAPLLAALGADVRGVARSAGTRAGFDVIAEEDVDGALQGTDVLIMVLPATGATQHALDAERLADLPAHAYVVNLGRGSTVDEDALIEALAAGRLAGAALDVTAIEPLPADSALWDAPGVLLTPHAAGGRPVNADELIAENLRAFLAGTTMRNVIER